MNKRIYRDEFNKTLGNMPDISRKERDYLNKAFNKELVDGLTPWELKQKIGQLHFNKKDELDRWELESVKKRLLGGSGK